MCPSRDEKRYYRLAVFALKAELSVKVSGSDAKAYTIDEFQNHQINLLDIIFCPDHPNYATNRRKPGPGMFLEAKRKYDLNLMRARA